MHIYYLGDLAEVREGVIDPVTLVSGNGQKAALINVARQIRGNILQVADGVWRTINGRNLRENILPTRTRANLILVKGPVHRVQRVLLRRL